MDLPDKISCLIGVVLCVVTTGAVAQVEEEACRSISMVVLSQLKNKPASTQRDVMTALDDWLASETEACRQQHTCLSKPDIVKSLQSNNPNITVDEVSHALWVIEPVVERQAYYGCTNVDTAAAEAAAAGAGRMDYERAAKHGDAAAQYNLGMLYFKGAGGVRKDYPTAYFWLALAAGGNKTFVAARDEAAGHLSPEQLAKGQGDVQEWQPYPGTDKNGKPEDKEKPGFTESLKEGVKARLKAMIKEEPVSEPLPSALPPSP
jgi:hypothetical protein